MKNHISTHGWEFDFDYDKTHYEYEQHFKSCACAPCRNFYQNVGNLPSDLVEFLEQLGIIVERPIEMWSSIAVKEEGIVDYVLCYAVCGTVRQPLNDEIDIDDLKILLMTPGYSPPTKFSKPFFVLEIFNVWLPWTVEDDLDECYPEKKTLKEKIRNHFRRLKKS